MVRLDVVNYSLVKVKLEDVL